MGVRRRDIDIQWFSSLGLLVAGGLLFRWRRVKDKHLNKSLKDTLRQYYYVPEWMDRLTRKKQEKSVKEMDEAEKANWYLTLLEYRRVKKWHDRIFKM